MTNIFSTLYEVAAAVEVLNEEEFNWAEDHSPKYETKRGEKDQFTNKHHVHVYHNGDKIGTISPYTARNDKKQANSRIVLHQGYVTRYSINFDHGKGPKISATLKNGHKSAKDALRYMSREHQYHLTQQK